MLDGIREVVDREASTAAGRSYPIVQGALGSRAEALGGAVLAMDSESRQMLAATLPPTTAPAGRAA
jgi:hypothetical protein